MMADLSGSWRETMLLPQYRVTSFQVQSSKFIDSISLNYDDGSTWSHGPEKGSEKTQFIKLVQGECLTSVTHGSVPTNRRAGSRLILESSRGRIFKFESICASLPQSKSVTIRASPGMEIIALKIRNGELQGIVQQQSLGGNPTEETDWFSVLYTKEKSDKGEKIKEFSNRVEAEQYYKDIAKAFDPGYATLLIDVKDNKIIQKAGKDNVVATLTKVAEERGLYNDSLVGKARNTSPFGVAFSLMSVISGRGEFIWLSILISLLLLASNIFSCEAIKTTGMAIVLVTTNNSIDIGYADFWCRYVMECAPGSHYDVCKAVINYLMLMVFLERFFYLSNVFVHHRAIRRLNAILESTTLCKALELDQAYHDTHSKSEVKAACDVPSINMAVTVDLPYSLSILFDTLLTAYYTVRQNWEVGSIIVMATTFMNVTYFLPMTDVERRIYKLQGGMRDLASELKDEALDTISTIKMFSTEGYHVSGHEKASRNSLVHNSKVVAMRCQREFFFHGIKYFTLAILLYLSITNNERYKLGPGSFMTFFLLMEKYVSNLHRFSYHYSSLVTKVPAIERYLSFMKLKSGLSLGEKKVKSLKGNIILKNVKFSYPSRPSDSVLNDISLNIQPNKMTAIVGDSGAGKSTIAKLLTRLYEPTGGEIYIGGTDIRAMDIKGYLAKIAVVSQSPDLINTTLMENIAYGSYTVALTEVEKLNKTIEMAKCDFIQNFRGGLDTFAGSKGNQLSGGQKQRIAIARAILRDPDLLILDEATSALDARNETEIHEALETLMKGRTTVVIAHRLSTIKNADEIICMKDGKVIEKGTHTTLMAAGGFYSRLVSNQLMEENKGHDISVKR